MTDPRKGTRHVAGPAAEEIRHTIHSYLLATTTMGAQAVGCTGASFVTMGIGIWAAELAELDPKATGVLLRALADKVDPKATPAARAAAEGRRRYAVDQLHKAVDLAMTRTEGRA